MNAMYNVKAELVLQYIKHPPITELLSPDEWVSFMFIMAWLYPGEDRAMVPSRLERLTIEDIESEIARYKLEQGVGK